MSLPDDVVRDLQQAQQERNRAQALGAKLGELYGEAAERARVVETLKDMDEKRVCYRLVGEVLVQRTAGDVRKEIEVEAQRLAQLIEETEKQRDDALREARAITTKHSGVIEQLNNSQRRGAR